MPVWLQILVCVLLGCSLFANFVYYIVVKLSKMAYVLECFSALKESGRVAARTPPGETPPPPPDQRKFPRAYKVYLSGIIEVNAEKKLRKQS